MIDIGGVPVCFRAADARRIAAIGRLLDGAPAHTDRPSVVVSYLRRRPALPRRRPDHTYDDVRVWHWGDDLVVQDASDVRARVTARVAWIGGEADDLEGPFQRLFHFAVTHLLASQDCFVLHGAGVAREGAASVALGPTGCGKSTLGLAAVSAGWQLLGDDMVVVRPGRNGLEVAGIARRPAVPGDLYPMAHAGEALADDHRGRWGLPPGSLTPGWFPLVGALFVDHGRTPAGGLEPLAAEDALLRVLTSFSSVTDPRQLYRFFPVAAAISRLPVWTLSHGSDPATRLLVAQLLLENLSVSSPA